MQLRRIRGSTAEKMSGPQLSATQAMDAGSLPVHGVAELENQLRLRARTICRVNPSEQHIRKTTQQKTVKDRVNLKLTEKLGHSALFLGSLRCVSLFEPVVDKTFRGSGVHSTCTWCTASCTA